MNPSASDRPHPPAATPLAPPGCIVCTCHGLRDHQLDAAIHAGSTSVKTCLRYHGVMPKCGDCVHAIRTRLADLQPTPSPSVDGPSTGATGGHCPETPTEKGTHP